jgi:hypothetical protein
VAEFGLRPAPRRARAALAAFGTIYRRLPRATVALPAFGAALHRVTGEAPSRLAGFTERVLESLAQRATGA